MRGGGYGPKRILEGGRRLLAIKGRAARSVLDGPALLRRANSGRSRRSRGARARDPRRRPYDDNAIPSECNTAGESNPISRSTLQRRVLSDGTECPLPIRYFDVQCLVATFLTDLDRAAELLKGTGLQAVPQEDGKAVVVLYCIEYRKTDIGPYNEVGLTVLAKAPGDPIPANYVVNLPVTTAVANRAGREIWGYNKFVAAIDVNSDGKKFSTILRDTDNEIIGALEGRRGASVPAPPTDILTFTLLRGRVIKTVIQVLTPFHASSGESFVFQGRDVQASDDEQSADLGTRWSASGAGALCRPISGTVIPRPRALNQTSHQYRLSGAAGARRRLPACA